MGESLLMYNDTKEVMRKLTVSIPDSLDEDLRKYVEENYEGLKGGLSITVKAALKEFLNREKKK
jgi:hypothetical protein